MSWVDGKKIMVLASSAAIAVALACGGSDSSGARPDGWGEDSHGKQAFDYGEVFPSGEVRRLDVTIAAADWQAMLADMTELYGEFGTSGQGGGDGGGGEWPPEMITACAGLSVGDRCDAPTPGGEVAGTCLEFDALVCLPDMMISACAALSEGDVCTLPPPPAGEPPPPGTCERSVGGTLACLIPMGPPPMGDTDDPIWVPVTVVYAGRTWWYVGMRFKGNSTLWGTWERGSYKLPFKLDFDQFEDAHPEIDDQRFWGFKKIAFANNARDDSYLREKVTGDLFRESGVPSPRRAFYRIYLDIGEGPIYFGLYTGAEVPDEPMFTSQFGEDGGNLYKPDGPGATWQSSFPIDDETFAKKSNEETADWSDVTAARSALHASPSDASAWRAELESYFDSAAFMRWLAVNTVLQDWDTYGNSPHNYYLYGDPAAGGRLSWIPWDLNESLTSTGGMFPPHALDLATVTEEWPLIRFLADDQEYAQLYWEAVAAFASGVFAENDVRARLEAEHELIAPYVVGEEGEQEPHTVLSSSAAFSTSVDEIMAHVARRHAAVDAALSARRE